ncbi:MAG: hypothetical protein J7J30_03725 [Candidatus Odinarchaeota archaeon]|nr:hypothetical protein [Candidatus Odinarchaeota archaeon]
MPKAIVLLYWDPIEGARIEYKYPIDADLSRAEAMKIFTSHAIGGGTAGFMSMSIGDKRIVSYFSGIEVEPQRCLVVLLDEAEEPLEYAEILPQSAENLFSQLSIMGREEAEEFIRKTFEELKTTTPLTYEQMLFHIFADPLRQYALTKKLIEKPYTLKRLQEEVEFETGRTIDNVNIFIRPFKRSGLVIVEDIRTQDGSILKDVVFLIQDAIMYRVPPARILELTELGEIPPQISKQYIEDVKNFFTRSYDPFADNSEDNESLAKFFLNRMAYQLLLVLRENVGKISEIAERTHIDENDAKDLLRRMELLDVISFYDVDGEEYAILKSDVTFKVFFPEYLVDKLQRRVMEGEIPREVAKRHLELLGEMYMRLHGIRITPTASVRRVRELFRELGLGSE